jgi:Subtilase family
MARHHPHATPLVARRCSRRPAVTMLLLGSLMVPGSASAYSDGGPGSDHLDRIDQHGPREVREVRIRSDGGHGSGGHSGTGDLDSRLSRSAGGHSGAGGPPEGGGSGRTDVTTASLIEAAPVTSTNTSGSSGSNPFGTSDSPAVKGLSGSTSGSSGGSGSSNSSGTSGSSGSGTSGTSGSSGSSGTSGTSGSSGSSDSSGTSGPSGSSGDSGTSGSSGSSDATGEATVSASGFHDLASREKPDFDPGGFPVRRGEVVSINASEREIARVRARGFRVIEDSRLTSLGLRLVRLQAPAGVAASQALSDLRAADTSTVYELDHYFTVNGGPDRRQPSGARRAALPAKRDPGMWVGIIDTAVAPHAALRAVRLETHSLVEQSGGPVGGATHGTAVASILARQGAGRLTSVNVFSNDPRPFASADAIARAVDWLAGHSVPVINISIAGPRNVLIDRVIGAAAARGIAIVAAAGNGGPTAMPAYPAASPGAVAVTAVDGSGQVYLHANRGSYITISAPGVGVEAAGPGSSLRAYSGTSFAAPVVAAYLARCLRRQDLRRAHACIDRMEASAHDLGSPGRDPIYGFGLLQP